MATAPLTIVEEQAQRLQLIMEVYSPNCVCSVCYKISLLEPIPLKK